MCYKPDLKPWQYKDTDLIPLCRACHAEVHGKITRFPAHGWNLVDWIDNGDIVENCDVCGTAIRYSFFISHPNVNGIVMCGCDCCDKFTDVGACKIMDELKRNERFRLKAYPKKRFYFVNPNTELCYYKIKGVNFNGFCFNIEQTTTNKFRLVAKKSGFKPIYGRIYFNTIQGAMNRARLIYAKNQNPFGETC